MFQVIPRAYSSNEVSFQLLAHYNCIYPPGHATTRWHKLSATVRPDTSRHFNSLPPDPITSRPLSNGGLPLDTSPNPSLLSSAISEKSKFPGFHTPLPSFLQGPLGVYKGRKEGPII